MHLGIDYGSKMAGTTAICCLSEGQLVLRSSKKNQDADQFIIQVIDQLQFTGPIYLDAPLSLPGVYRDMPGYHDYFYRKADRALSAMSPMFLGGLTARAMKLKATLANISFYEAYPTAAAKLLGLHDLGYKKQPDQIELITEKITAVMSLELKVAPASWHELDALLAYWVGYKSANSQAQSAGDPQEGMIYY